MRFNIKKIIVSLLCVGVIFGTWGCNRTTDTTEKVAATEDTNQSDSLDEKEDDAEVLSFVDAFEESYEVEINPDIEKHNYDFSNLVSNDENGPMSGSGNKVRSEFLSYEDNTFTSRIGIDVSYHQGEIDWEKVKGAGVEFVFVRIGFRGYGEAGNIKADENALSYIEGAKNSGLDVGVYFYSQAINETEAKEEAEFVLSQLNGMKLELPVVYDPEHVLDDEARTDDVTGEQFTKNAVVFLDTIKEAGYTPAIYANMLWEAFELDLTKLSDYDIWYADYEAIPQSPYHFKYWQYSNTGSVDGISGEVDLNLEFVD
ncbi:MAG: glycoside hydrolase family 25 protein [Lachnospiraceae bacterium]|nr:glycoside hydrolase family 25 protein [Lachnospiraceae bacterium]